MKRLLWIGMCGMLAAACTSDPEGYKIKGNIANAGDGIAILSVSAGRETVGTPDTVEMKGGAFTFTGKLETPMNVVIQVCPEGGQPAALGFIAENKPIRVEADWNKVVDQYGYRSFQETAVEGSRNEEVARELNSVYGNIKARPEYAPLARLTPELYQSDKEAYEQLKAETEELSARLRAEVSRECIRLILEHRDVEAVGATLMMQMRDLSYERLDCIYNALAPNVQESPLMAEVCEELAARKRVQPGMPAPDFTLQTPDGGTLSLSDLRGKYVILDFWASWCAPCRASFPAMKEIYAQYKDKGLEILGISNDSRREDWLRALEQDQLPWKSVVDEFPAEGFGTARVISMYAVSYLPTLILIDPDGKIVGTLDGEPAVKAKLAEIFG